MKRYGIERNTLFITLLPILVMGILLESYFIYTRFDDLDKSLHQRAHLLARQLASSCEYPVFSGNAGLLKKNIDAALLLDDVEYISVYDAQAKLLLFSRSKNAHPRGNMLESNEPIYQDGNILKLREPILATQISLDDLLSAPSNVSELGAVVIEVSKRRLNAQKKEILLVSMLFTLLVIGIAMLLALRAARRIIEPVMQMHKAVRSIAGGELDVVVSQPAQISELQELSDGINDMALHLLRDRELLENRIVETTSGLREMNREVELAQREKAKLNENLSTVMRDMQAIMEANPDLLYVFNKQGELVQWNSSLEKFFGLPADKLRNIRLLELFGDGERDEIATHILEVYVKTSTVVEGYLLRHDGVKVPYMCNAVVLKNSQNEITGFTGTGRDVSERMAVKEQMYRMEKFDLLTGLPNRSLFTDRLQQVMITSKRAHKQFALLYLDLDMFKYINDKFGHDVGDRLLQEVAHRIQSCLGESDLVARFGGDEFVVLLSTVATEFDVMSVAEKIRNAINQAFELPDSMINNSVSIGIVMYPDHGIDGRALLKNSETAMYLAKRKGRNTVVLFSS